VGRSRPGGLSVVAVDRATRAEELARFRAYRDSGDQDARNALVEEFRWVAVHCARRFADRGEPLDDLVQVAQLGVLKAVTRFDPDMGVSFVSFALPTVLGELRRYFRDATWSVRVPRRIKDLHVEVGSSIEFLTGELGRPPRPDQLAGHLGVDVQDILEALDAGSAYRTTPLASSGERGDDEPVGLVLGLEDVELGRSDDRQMVRRLLAELPDRERTILELRFANGLSQSEIADRVGVSQVHVSRLLRKSLRLLQERLASEGEGADGPVDA
jgi:RNA polymerase sigma-B factor